MEEPRRRNIALVLVVVKEFWWYSCCSIERERERERQRERERERERGKRDKTHAAAEKLPSHNRTLSLPHPRTPTLGPWCRQ